MSSLLLAAIFLVVLPAGCFVWGLLFWQSTRLVGVAGVSLTKAILLAVVILLVNVGITLLLRTPPPDSVIGGAGLMVLKLAAGVIASLAMLKLFVRGGLGRIALAGILSSLVTASSLLLVLVLTIPFTCKAFVVPTNGMAPTLKGKHWTGDCPRCGAPAYASAPDPRDAHFDGETRSPLTMICSREMTSCQVSNAKADPVSSDRILVCRVLHPRRWDVVAFQYPADPTKSYVQRLVGLPGETVVIEAGAVWINGQKLVAPGGQHYLSEMSFPNGERIPLRGTKQEPARLGSDEYFMLGDFSENSADSRVWREGAPGHPSYAVPGSYIIGVATHIYWPYARWRVLR